MYSNSSVPRKPGNLPPRVRHMSQGAKQPYRQVSQAQTYELE